MSDRPGLPSGPGAHALTQSALQAESGAGRQHGRVTYTHGGGIDQPLGVYRDGYANEYGSAGAFLVVPHASWRGRFDLGTYPAGSAAGLDVRWPGQDDRVFHNGGGATGRGDWMGGLLNEMRDASGLMYRRNRYYDPQTGRFTQEDPIGIAGGLNVYGYAAGDPVSYSDPYGLCPPVWSCLAGRGPKTAITVAEFREGRREHFTWPIDIVVTPTKDTTVRGGFNDEGQYVLFMQGGLKLQTDLLPEGASHIAITLAAVNVDTGEFDAFGRVGPNLVWVEASGNFKTGEFQGRVCGVGLCFSDSSENKANASRSPREREQHDTGAWCGKVGCE